MNNHRISKKSVLITGCSSGIGRSLAMGLHDRGYRVIASCRKSRDISGLNELGISGVVLDLDDSRLIEEGFSRAMELSEGTLFALINNGAYGQPGAVEDLSRESLVAQFQTNVFGTQELTNLVIPKMRENNTGRIIQISSVLGIACLKFRGAYNASKYALEALTDTMRLELMDTDIQLSLVQPGPIKSDFRKNAYMHYRQNIDPDSSEHRSAYRALEKRLLSNEPVRFTLPPESVLKAVIHALESRRPKIRYPVTIPTRIIAPLKRILPDRSMDRFLNAND